MANWGGDIGKKTLAKECVNDHVKFFEIMFGQRKGYKGEIKNNYCEWGGEDGGGTKWKRGGFFKQKNN